MARYPIYQIDFSAVSAGKHVASTKRRIKWRFGFPNEEALANGETGTACRGEEHDVVVVWSITSGKRQIMMDGREVHFSTNRTNALEHSWTSRGNHIVKVICHAAPPMTATPGFRQYDLFIDGQSFFTMPKMYELGLRGGGGARDARSRSAAPPSSSYKAPRSPEEEQEELQRAIRASLEESRIHLEQRGTGPPPPPALPPAPAPPALTDGDDLMSLGMGDPTVPGGYDSGYGAYHQPPAYHQQPAYQQTPVYEQPPAYQYSQSTAAYPTSNAGASSYPALPAPVQGNSYYSQQPPAPAPYAPQPPSYAPQPAYAPAPSYAASPAPPQSSALLTESYTSNPTGITDIYDSYAAEDPFAPKAAPPASHAQKSNEILSAYGSPSGTTGYNGYQSPDAKGGNAQTLTLTNGDTPGSNSMMNFEEEEPSNPFDAALKKLVNVDHIDQPAEVHLAVKKKVDEADAMKKKGKSKGLPPAAHQVVGGQATLSQISDVKPKKQPKEDIMRPPPQLFSAEAQQAGMMVVYGQPNQGPPPLQQRGYGFGVGYSQPGGYGAQPGYGAQAPPRAYY